MPLEGGMEAILKYQPFDCEALTLCHYLAGGQWQAGSLTGAVASQRVTEAFKGSLRANRNRLSSACAEESLTARPTSRADGKPGASDPVVECGIAIAQRIKATPGITGLTN